VRELRLLHKDLPELKKWERALSAAIRRHRPSVDGQSVVVRPPSAI
jgi:hypothetical protein